MTLMYYPLVVLGIMMVRWFEDNIVIAFAVGTVIGKFFMIKIFPMLKNCLVKEKRKWTEDKKELRSKIVKLAEDHGYKNAENKVMLTANRGGDLHSNASVNSGHIDISESLLNHHDGKDGEILAIMAHELGHWKNNDIYWVMFVDIFYMTLIGFFYAGCQNNPLLLSSFGFTQKSYFISIYCFFKVCSVTADYPLRKLYNILYRF